MDKINKNKIEGVSGGTKRNFVVKLNEKNGYVDVYELSPDDKETHVRTIEDVHGFDDVERIDRYYNNTVIRKK